MKTILKFVVCTVAVLFVGRQLAWLIASDETQIRWTVEDMIEGFNDARLAKATNPIHKEWRAAGERITKPRLQDGLRYLFTQEKHPETKAFLYRVELIEDSLIVEVDEEAETAEVELSVRFFTLEEEPPVPVWQVELENSFVKDEEAGWSVIETRHENVEGTDLRSRHGF